MVDKLFSLLQSFKLKRYWIYTYDHLRGEP